jgi:hypothetical protein
LMVMPMIYLLIKLLKESASMYMSCCWGEKTGMNLLCRALRNYKMSKPVTDKMLVENNIPLRKKPQRAAFHTFSKHIAPMGL